MIFDQVLIPMAHADDAEISMGGTIARLVEEGRNVQILSFCCGKGISPSTREEHRASAAALGVKQYEVLDYHPAQPNHEGLVVKRGEIFLILDEIKREWNPTCIITHASHDTHQDHAQVREEVLRVFRGGYSILGGILPPNEGDVAVRRCFVALTEQQLEKKVQACGAFVSQHLPHRRGFDPDIIQAQARYWGLVAGVPLAEALEVTRILL